MVQMRTSFEEKTNQLQARLQEVIADQDKKAKAPPPDTDYQQWVELPKGPDLTDGLGWDRPQCYQTIQTQVVRTNDGKDKLLLVARGAHGIRLWTFNPNKKEWE